MSNVPLELRKQLFRSPSNEDGNSALMFKLQMEHDLELSYQGLQKELFNQIRVGCYDAVEISPIELNGKLENDLIALLYKQYLHEKRMKQLRQKAKALAENDWQYPPIEKLIGLH